MQLLAVVIWNHDGASRVIRFRPGRLNVITGRSRAGKSALLDIVEYCLGRDHRQVPSGPITATVAWYGLLVDIRGQRVFIGRPEPKAGNASTQVAMLRIGADTEPPPFAELAETTDTVGLRAELGRLLGISDGQVGESTPVTSVYAPTVGHAAWFCLQKQDEVASQTHLFHRQGEEGILRSLREVLPFFLGAVAGDATLRKAELAQQRRNLVAAQAGYDAAVRSEAEAEITVRVLLEQAFAQGLTDVQHAGTVEAGLSLLKRAAEGSLAVSIDDTERGRRERGLRVRRDELRQQLRQLGERQALLEEDTVLRDEYLDAVNDQVGRLQTVKLLPKATIGAADICPLCDQTLAEPDATVDQIVALATQLSAGVEQIAASTTPGRRQAQATLGSSAARLRTELRQIEAALTEFADASLIGLADEKSYQRGRLSVSIEALERDRSDLVRRRAAELQLLATRVTELEAGLDAEAERAELESRLSLVNAHLVEIAQKLHLEHSDGPVRLDVHKLTVVADTTQGPVPLSRIGSAENWMGYHIAVHLALHQFFAEAERPVPRFLMLDQPTQAYYPPDRQQPADGAFLGDDDRQAVVRLFKLLSDWVDLQEGQVQVIVVDHADLDEDWFASAVIERWRGPDAGLIPESWLSS